MEDVAVVERVGNVGRWVPCLAQVHGFAAPSEDYHGAAADADGGVAPACGGRRTEVLEAPPDEPHAVACADRLEGPSVIERGADAARVSVVSKLGRLVREGRLGLVASEEDCEDSLVRDGSGCVAGARGGEERTGGREAIVFD